MEGREATLHNHKPSSKVYDKSITHQSYALPFHIPHTTTDEVATVHLFIHSILHMQFPIRCSSYVQPPRSQPCKRLLILHLDRFDSA